MKDKYIKPEIFFESYELSAHMAACRWDMKNQSDWKLCEAVFDPDMNNTEIGQSIFTETPRCTFPTNDKNGVVDGLDEYCYTTGTSENIRVFNS